MARFGVWAFTFAVKKLWWLRTTFVRICARRFTWKFRLGTVSVWLTTDIIWYRYMLSLLCFIYVGIIRYSYRRCIYVDIIGYARGRCITWISLDIHIDGVLLDISRYSYKRCIAGYHKVSIQTMYSYWRPSVSLSVIFKVLSKFIYVDFFMFQYLVYHAVCRMTDLGNLICLTY